MTYRVDLTPRASRDLSKLPNDVVRTATQRLARLADDPRPRQSLKLRGEPPRWRLRFGDFRCIYSIADRRRLVLVLRVVRRSERTYD